MSPSGSVTVKLSLSTRWFTSWLRLVGAVAPLIGERRAWAAAGWGVNHLLRYRLDDGRWRRLPNVVEIDA